MSKILALDLGLKCGWAYTYEDMVCSGVWNLLPSKQDSYGVRFMIFKEYLKKILPQLNLIVYEEVRSHAAVLAAQHFGSLRGILQLLCEENKIEYRGVPVGTIKKFATGSGNAQKDKMIEAAQRLFPSINILDDNHADALCLLRYAQKNLII